MNKEERIIQIIKIAIMIGAAVYIILRFETALSLLEKIAS